MIKGYDIYKINLPLGRQIGDNNCYYDSFHVCVVKLADEAGNEAWGYGEKVVEGYFSKSVSWQGQMASLEAIKEDFEINYWPLFKKTQSVEEIMEAPVVKGDHYLKNALRYALWDLKAKQEDLPLYKLLNPNARQNFIPAYVSGLDFHNDIEWLIDFYQKKISQGFKKIKLKIGHQDPDWDLERLSAIRQQFGKELEISADANIAWDAKTAIKNLEYFQSKGVNLSYIEDPIPPDDIEGFELLAKELSIDIAGHDYIPNPENLKPLLDTGAITYLRIRDGVDYGIRVAEFAEEYDLELIDCNTFMEWGLHIGVGNPRINRIEFADLGWNQLAKTPFKLENGNMYVSDVLGHGLDPKLELLEKWKV